MNPGMVLAGGTDLTLTGNEISHLNNTA
jgi:hypothetical protein